MKQIKIKKLGNHWYVDLIHESLEDVSLNNKIERVLNVLSDTEEIILTFYESGSILYKDTLQISDESLTRYFTTNDEFDMDFWIGDRNFKISSNIYYLLECQFDFSFHDTPYRVELCRIY